MDNPSIKDSGLGAKVSLTKGVDCNNVRDKEMLILIFSFPSSFPSSFSIADELASLEEVAHSNVSEYLANSILG